MLRPTHLDDRGFEPVGRIFWLGDDPSWVGVRVSSDGVAHAFVAVPPSGGPARVLAMLTDERACEPIAGAGVMVAPAGGHNAALIRPQATTLDPLPESGGGRDALAACLHRTGTARLALRNQGFEVSGIAVRGDTIVACRTGADGSTEIWLINSAERTMLTAVSWPLARDNPVLEFQAYEQVCLIYPSLLPRRRAELRSRLPGLPVLIVAAHGTTKEAWVDWGDWNAEGGYRVTRNAHGLAVGILHGWTDAGERHSGLWQRGTTGWVRVAAGQLDPGSLAASGDGRSIAWREQRLLPAGASRRFRYVAMRFGAGTL